MNLANIFFKIEKFKEALDYYDVVIKLDNKNLNAYLNKGNIYLKLDNYTYAIKNY